MDDVSQLDEIESKHNNDTSSRKSNHRSSQDEGNYFTNIKICLEKNRKSIIVRNLDIDTSIDEIEKLFSKFGLVNKVTMICDKYTGKSKGYLINFYSFLEQPMSTSKTKIQKRSQKI